MLYSTGTDAAINHIHFYSSSRTSRTYGIQLDDDSIVDLAGLKNLKFLCKLIVSKGNQGRKSVVERSATFNAVSKLNIEWGFSSDWNPVCITNSSPSR